MSQGRDMEYIYQKDITDQLERISMSLYVLAVLLFLGGLWIDWQNPGQVVIPALVVADEPYANSGLFIGCFIVVVIGFTISQAAGLITNYKKSKSQSQELEEQDQEWSVDINEEI